VRDQVFYKPKKYLSWRETDFKFLVLWSVFKGNTNKIDTLKKLASLDQDDIKDLNRQKQKIVLYQNTLETDKTVTNAYALTPDLVLKMYKQNKISCLFVVWYFNKHGTEGLGRINRRTVQRCNFFLSYFPAVSDYLR